MASVQKADCVFQGLSSDEETAKSFVRIATDDGDSFQVPLPHSDVTILHVKHWISQTLHIPVNSLTLFNENQELSDKDIVGQLEMYGSSPRLRLVAEDEMAEVIHFLGLKNMGATLEVDLTNVVDNGERYKQGGQSFNPPLDWMVYSLNGIGKFKDSQSNKSTFMTDGAISYSPVMHKEVAAVFKRGYIKPEACFPDCPISSIITSVDPTIAESMAQEFSCGKKRYKLLVMNRVNSEAASNIGLGDTGIEVDVINSAEHVCPFGVIFKKVAG